MVVFVFVSLFCSFIVIISLIDLLFNSFWSIALVSPSSFVVEIIPSSLRIMDKHQIHLVFGPIDPKIKCKIKPQ